MNKIIFYPFFLLACISTIALHSAARSSVPQPESAAAAAVASALSASSSASSSTPMAIAALSKVDDKKMSGISYEETSPKTLERMPENMHTPFFAGWLAVNKRASAWFTLIEQYIQLPKPLRFLVLDYAALPDDPHTAVMSWLSPNITIRGLGVYPSDCRWLGNENLVSLIKFIHDGHNKNVLRNDSISGTKNVCTEVPLTTNHVFCSPDGTMIATTHDNGLISFWDNKLQQGDCVQLKDAQGLHECEVIDLSWSPDMSMLCTFNYCTRDYDTKKIRVFVLNKEKDGRITLHPYYEYGPTPPDLMFFTPPIKWASTSKAIFFVSDTLLLYTLDIPQRKLTSRPLPKEIGDLSTMPFCLSPEGNYFLIANESDLTINSLSGSSSSRVIPYCTMLGKNIKRIVPETLCWNSNGLLIIGLELEDEPKFSHVILLVDTLSGSPLKKLFYHGTLSASPPKPSPNGSKIFVAHSAFASIFEPQCSREKIDEDIRCYLTRLANVERVRTLLKRMHLIPLLRNAHHYITMMKIILLTRSLQNIRHAGTESLP